jgi:hypothetical protein
MINGLNVDMENFAKVRKQILKGIEVDYFNKER